MLKLKKKTAFKVHIFTKRCFVLGMKVTFVRHSLSVGTFICKLGIVSCILRIPSCILFPVRISRVTSLEVSALVSLTLKTLKKGTSPYYVPGITTSELYSYSFNAKEQSARSVQSLSHV